MERNPIANDRRHARRTRRLPPDAACARCGTTTPEALTLVDRSLLEAHHVVTKAHDGTLTLPLCLNCHRILTEGQARAGVTFAPQSTIPERIAAILTALSAFFADLSASLALWAASLTAFVATLDAAPIEWRTLPGVVA